MIVGFTGASATGKSWVARKLATQLGFSYVPSKASEVAKRIGFDVNTEHEFSERMEYQNAVFNQMTDDIGRDQVFDRSPTDLMAFLIEAEKADINTKEVEEYLEDCVRMAERFDVIFYICPPLEDLMGSGEYKPGRLSSESHGDDHRVRFNDTLSFLLNHPDIKNKVIKIPENLHYEERVEFCKGKLNERTKH